MTKMAEIKLIPGNDYRMRSGGKAKPLIVSRVTSVAAPASVASRIGYRVAAPKFSVASLKSPKHPAPIFQPLNTFNNPTISPEEIIQIFYQTGKLITNITQLQYLKTLQP